MRPLRAVALSARAAARRPRPTTARPPMLLQLHSDLLSRAFTSQSQSDDRDFKQSHTDSFVGTLSAGATAHPLHASADQDGGYDIDFTASRLGYSAYEDQGDHDPDDIREESRQEATAKAERILAILRHSMTELDIGRVIHRISQFATTPRVTHQTRKQFLKSLEGRFGPEHQREHELVLAFLLGKDHVIDQLKEDSRDAMDALASADHHSNTSTTPQPRPDEREVLVPEIMGLHPELVADPKFIGVVFCYCRMACLNSQKLLRPPQGQHRHPKSSLLQVKHDYRRVLDSEGLSHFAEMMGVKAEPQDASSTPSSVDASSSFDAEWDEFNLENDRIDFRMLLAQTQSLIALMKTELSDETITKMLIAMLASLKTTKLHRKIFQEMVCNIQAALPEHFHEPVLRQLVPFLSGNQATYDDFESDSASVALQHHRSRHEAILRALLETRMRLGHILIHDLDALDPLASISPKLPASIREDVITTAWNIVSVLNDREYHVFFSRFLKHKLAWRPSRATFGQTFLDDVSKALGPRKAEVIMPLFEKVFLHLSVETLTICRVKLRHSHKLLRESATVQPVDDRGRERLESHWRPERCVFYRNLPHGTKDKHLRASLEHIGKIKRFVFFADPVNGPPDEIEDAEASNADGSDTTGVEDDDDSSAVVDEDGEIVMDDEEEDEVEVGVVSDEEDDDDEVEEGSGRRVSRRELRTPRKKTYVIASDKKTPYHALVEFESESAKDRALQQALQIFGVMVSGWKEYRPVFASACDARTSISVLNIPYGTTIESLLKEMQAILSKSGLTVELSASVPRGVVITNGRIELRFDSFAEASQVVDVLNAHVSKMKSRREPTGEDLALETARTKYLERRQKTAKTEERKAKRLAKKAAAAEEEELEDMDEELELVEEDVEDASKAFVDPFDENEDAYFAGEFEDEQALSDEERALREVPRPFDVTWNRPPRAKNNHMYV